MHFEPGFSFSVCTRVCVSGRTDVVRSLLDAGADTAITNKLGKTAAQLGAFVGQYESVQLINSYCPVSDLEALTKPLHSDDALTIQQLLSSTRLHPVHVRTYHALVPQYIIASVVSNIKPLD